MLHKHLNIGTCKAAKCKSQKNVRCYPGPVGVRAFEQSQNDADPYPVKRDSSVLRVAHKEEKRRSCKASKNVPPLLVFHEEKAEMTSRHADDCDGLQPIGIVNRTRRGSRTGGVVHSHAILRHLQAPRGFPRSWLSSNASP